MNKIKKIFFILILITPTFSYTNEKNEEFDGKGGRDDISYLNAKNSNFKKGNDALKQALKLKKKNKFKKSNKRLEKAVNYFVLANKENPNNLQILNLLGFSYNLLGDTIMSEIYYTDALIIDPKNNLINQKLGELYFNTKRIDLAKQRLDLLVNCNCREYVELKKVISGTK
tara:strand:- start:835 stop:1347 length:513 start_codon:yes stop_codon:yes gene_type:complete